MNTLLLDIAQWDLVADADGNIAMATDPYSVAQDVATACRTFVGDCWYNLTLGLPYWSSILGQFPPIALLKAQYIQAALTVPGVSNPRVFLGAIAGRNLTGQIQFTDSNGETQAVGVGGPTTIYTKYAITDTASEGVTDGGQQIVVG